MDWGRDLRAKIPNAPNFTYGEMVRSDTAIRLGIVNKPTMAEWARIEDLAQLVLQPIRNEFGRIKILSGFRTVELCIAVGSSKTSYHAFGGAADIEPYDATIGLFDVLEWISENINYNELIAEYFPEGWVHVGRIRGDDRCALKLKDANHHFKRVSLAYVGSIYG